MYDVLAFGAVEPTVNVTSPLLYVNVPAVLASEEVGGVNVKLNES